MTNKSRNVRHGKIKVRKVPVKIQPEILNEKTALYEKPLFLVITILILTFIAFLPSLKNDFISTWDDGPFISGNSMIRHLDFQSIKAMFSTPVLSAYVPLPLLSFAIEYHFFGLNPIPFHISNLLLHLGCTFLVFYFFRLLKLENVYAAFGALLFGIHPMHVESVAWISERKDLLFTLFYLFSMIFYLLYIQKQTRGWKLLTLSLLFFILSLFSKIQAVALPLSLILLDYFLKRPFKSRLVYEKIPFFILSLLFGIAGVLILKRQGVLQINETYPLFQRIFFGFYALSAYIVKFFAPFHLSALYPYPISLQKSSPLFYYLNPLFLLLLGFFVYRSARNTRAIVFGILFFFFNILFLLQVVSAGSTYLADHYSYIPYIGLLFIVLWITEKIIKDKKSMRYFLFPVLAIITVFFISLTFNRCKTWENGIILWTDAIEKYPDGISTSYNDRGAEYANLNQWDKAIDDYTRAIGIEPNYVKTYSNRGNAYAKLGQWDKVVSDLSLAIGIDPGNKESYLNRGFAFANLRQPDKAIDDYNKAIGIDPGYKDAWYNRGNVYENLKQWDKAIDDYTRTIEIDPNFDSAYTNRGVVYAIIRQWDKAISDCSRAIVIDPNFETAYSNRGNVFSTLKKWDNAISDYSKVIEIDPAFIKAYLNRGDAYANLGQWQNAIADYSKVLESDPDNARANSGRNFAYKQLQQKGD